MNPILVRYFVGAFIFLDAGGAIIHAGEDFNCFPPEKKVVFVSATTLILFGVLSYTFTGSLIGAPFEFLLFVGVVSFVGVFALIKGYFKDKRL